MSSEVNWTRLTLQQAGVSLIDCDRRTPPAAAEGFPYIAIPQLKDGHVDLSGARRIAPADYFEWTKKLKPRAHDVIVVRRCNSGDSAIVPVGLDCAIGQSLVVLRANGVAIEPTFLRWLVRGPHWWDQVAKFINVGAVFDSLRCRDIPNFELTIPPLTVQRAISQVLGTLDDRIALLRETNATLEAIALALYKSWFVDFYPVRAKQQGLEPAGIDEATAALFPDSFEESAFGMLPRGWRVEPVGQVVEGIYDGPHATPPEAGSGPVFLGIKNLTGSGLDLAEVRHFAEADFAQWTRRVEPQAGDIVFSYEATLGFFALIPPALRCCLGRRLALVRPRSGGADGHFLFHQFVAAPFQRLLERHTIQGATVNRIALKQFPTYPVLNPPEGLKSRFDSVVAPLWARTHENQAQAQTLGAFRDSLLPRLISGQLRLPEAAALAV